MRQAVWLWALTLLITAAIILAFPTAPSAPQLGDSLKPEPTPVATPLIPSAKGKAPFYDAT